MFSTRPASCARGKRPAPSLRESLAPSDLAAVATFGQVRRSGARRRSPRTVDQVARAIEGLGVVGDTAAPARPLSIATTWACALGPGHRPAAQRQEAASSCSRAARGGGDRSDTGTRVEGSSQGSTRRRRCSTRRRAASSISSRRASIERTAARRPGVARASEAVRRRRDLGSTVGPLLRLLQGARPLDKLFRAVAVDGHSDPQRRRLRASRLASPSSPERFRMPVGQGSDTLAQFAVNTGGRFIADANDLRAGLEELLRATRHYYVLGFEPQNPATSPTSRASSRSASKARACRSRIGASTCEAAPRARRGARGGALHAAESIVKGLAEVGDRVRPCLRRRSRRARSMLKKTSGADLDSSARARRLQSASVFDHAVDERGPAPGRRRRCRPLSSSAPVRTSLEAKGLQFITSFAVPDGPVELRFLVAREGDAADGVAAAARRDAESDGDAMVLSPPLAWTIRAPASSSGALAGLPALEIPFRLADDSVHGGAATLARERRRARGLRDGLGRGPAHRAGPTSWRSRRSSSMPRALRAPCRSTAFGSVTDADGVGR